MWGDPFGSEPEDMHPGASDVYGLFDLIDRIHAYTRAGEVEREVKAVERWIDDGIEQFERLLANHAAFAEWVAERGESVA